MEQQQQQRHLAGEGVVQGRTLVPIVVKSTRHQRGCYFFSPRKKTLYILSLDWQRNLISDGLFTVESDRAVVVKLGDMALQSKKQHLNELGPLTDYRFHLSQQPRLLNQTKNGLELQSFLQHFNFPNIDAAVKHESGMTGMLCAILEGDVNIVQTLVEHHGDVNVRVSGIRHLGYSDGLTLLMIASYGVPDSKMHADPSLSCISETGSIITASWVASHPGHVEVLLEKKADFATSPILAGAVGISFAETVRAFLKARCDPNMVSSNGFGPMYSVSFFGRGNPHATEIMQLLLSLRGDVNAPS